MYIVQSVKLEVEGNIVEVFDAHATDVRRIYNKHGNDTGNQMLTCPKKRSAITRTAKTTLAIPFEVINARFTLLRSFGFTSEC